MYLDGRGFNFIKGNDDLALWPLWLRLTGRLFELGLTKAGAVRKNHSAPKQLGRLNVEKKNQVYWFEGGFWGRRDRSYVDDIFGSCTSLGRELHT